MSVWRLILREIVFRKLNSVLAVLSVAAAAACLVGSLTILRGHDLQTESVAADMRDQTEAIAAKMQAQTKARMKELEDDYRKIVLKLGFNVFIVPKGAQQAEAYDEDFGQREMPEEYVNRLAKANIITINHLLPSLSKRVHWPEQATKIVLTGIHGEVAPAGMKRHQPLVQPVEPGQMVLGFAVAQQTKLKPGDKTELLGQTFTVTKKHDFRGTTDDITVWIDLAQAQRLLKKEGKINAIQAINCLAERCYPDATGLPAVSEEIARILPDTQVLVDMGKAVTRINARKRAADEARDALAVEKQRRAAMMAAETERRSAMRAQIAQVTSILSPLAVVGAGLWVALLMLGNVRDRAVEIGILRALGLRAKQIRFLFFGKALLVGLLGAALGCAVGVAVGSFWYGSAAEESAAAALIAPWKLGLVVMLAPLVAMLASWPPALIAAAQDPAIVLRED